MARRRHEKATRQPEDREDDPTPQVAPLAPSTGFRARARRKLTDDALGRIFQRRADGWTWDAACAEEGVHTESLRQLSKRDAEVGLAYDTANAQGAKFYQAKIEGALDGDPEHIKAWTGWAWLAERFHPTVFRKPSDRVELDATVREVDGMTDEQVLDTARRIYEAKMVEARLLPAVDAEEEDD